uniref:Cyclin D2 n=1 Tax=Gadus morhua TaxID=8049 RepID=A0A8C4ZLH5_GADMO
MDHLLCLESDKVVRAPPDPNIFYDDPGPAKPADGGGTLPPAVLLLPGRAGGHQALHEEEWWPTGCTRCVKRRAPTRMCSPWPFSYLDRFLAIEPTKKGYLQLLGAVCLFIASKLKDCRTLLAEKLCGYTDNSISPRELLDWELVVSRKAAVEHCDGHPKRLHRAHHAPAATPQGQAASHPQAHADLHRPLCYRLQPGPNPPSMIATGSVGAAICGMQHELADQALHRDHLNVLLGKITNTEVDCLRECQEQIERVLVSSLREGLSKGPHKGHYTGENTREQQDLSSTPTDVRDVQP